MARRGPALVPGRPPGDPEAITPAPGETAPGETVPGTPGDSGHGDPEGISPAPGELEKVRAFVNTRDIEQGTDELTSPAALGAWLDQHGLAAGGRITRADLVLALELREALRGVLRSHAHPRRRRAAPPRAGAAVAPADGAAPLPPGGGAAAADGQEPAVPELVTLRRIAAGLPTQLQITADGRPGVTAGTVAGAGPAALAGLLLIAARAATLGTWERLKVCGADDCLWAFYDRSPTRSGSWCSMRICGSRAKSRAYRQ
ncbi:MAG TPA: CGNR zinc finger domain-containing protein, partial [Streptosporangiaceae bacterium]|nr:CGNR zinc finger domain-containing protein [Streptosporangiaceae bacterium]